MLLRKVVTLPDEAYVAAPGHGAKWTGASMIPVLNEALAANLGVFFFHTHSAAGPVQLSSDDRNSARQLLPALDLFANSSIHEGLSLTILEAMACELPVVATRVGGTPEAVADAQTGLLVPPRAPQALADALLALAASPERRRAMGCAGRLRAIQHFTIDRMLDSYLTAYRRQARVSAVPAVAV